MTKPRRERNLKFLRLGLVLVFCVSAHEAKASDFRLGVSLGYGGAGITSTTTVNSVQTTIQRSESPGTFSLFLDYLIGDYYSIAFEHSRGFRLGPFSSGVALTGIAGRWYFSTPAPSVTRYSPEGSTLVIRKFAPFFGLSTGVASGTITRENDEVPSVSASGIYVGYKLGADYPLGPGIGIRPEIAYGGTFMSSQTSPSSVSEFSLQCGFYFFL